MKNLSPDIICKQHLICYSCQKLYEAIENLCNLEKEFGKACGNKLEKESIYDHNISVRTFFKKNKEKRSKSWTLPNDQDDEQVFP